MKHNGRFINLLTPLSLVLLCTACGSNPQTYSSNISSSSDISTNSSLPTEDDIIYSFPQSIGSHLFKKGFVKDQRDIDENGKGIFREMPGGAFLCEENLLKGGSYQSAGCYSFLNTGIEIYDFRGQYETIPNGKLYLDEFEEPELVTFDAVNGSFALWLKSTFSGDRNAIINDFESLNIVDSNSYPGDEYYSFLSIDRNYGPKCNHLKIFDEEPYVSTILDKIMNEYVDAGLLSQKSFRNKSYTTPHPIAECTYALVWTGGKCYDGDDQVGVNFIEFEDTAPDSYEFFRHDVRFAATNGRVALAIADSWFDNHYHICDKTTFINFFKSLDLQ